MNRGAADARWAQRTVLALIALFFVMRAVFAADRPARSRRARPDDRGIAERGAGGAVASTWAADVELAADRRRERTIAVRELAVIAIVAALVVLRVVFVHDG